MIEDFDIYLSAVVEHMKRGEFDKAKEKIRIALQEMIVVDFHCRQKRINSIIIKIYRLRNIRDSILSEINSFPEDLQFHANESLKDTITTIEKEIMDLRRQRKKLSRPRCES